MGYIGTFPKNTTAVLGVPIGKINDLNTRVSKLEQSGAIGAWSPLTPDGTTVTFSVTKQPTDVEADGILLFSPGGYTYNAGASTITYNNPPQTSAHYR